MYLTTGSYCRCLALKFDLSPRGIRARTVGKLHLLHGDLGGLIGLHRLVLCARTVNQIGMLHAVRTRFCARDEAAVFFLDVRSTTVIVIAVLLFSLHARALVAVVRPLSLVVARRLCLDDEASVFVVVVSCLGDGVVVFSLYRGTVGPGDTISNESIEASPLLPSFHVLARHLRLVLSLSVQLPTEPLGHAFAVRFLWLSHWSASCFLDCKIIDCVRRTHISGLFGNFFCAARYLARASFSPGGIAILNK